MNNTTFVPFVQESFFSPAADPLTESVANSLGPDFADQGFFVLSSGLPTFRQACAPEIITMTKNYGSKQKPKYAEKDVILLQGGLNNYNPCAQYFCPICNAKLYENGTSPYMLAHVPFGQSYTKLVISRQRLRCSAKNCSYTYTFKADFQATGHMITQQLETYICDLLSCKLTLKEVSQLAGVNENLVKDIDKKRLNKLYTVNGEGKVLKKPEKQAVNIGVDEFKLHDGRQYATIFIDLDTGHVLYIAYTKKKQVVYDFIKFVGDDFMKGVKAVASDMNADFGNAFREKYPHIDIVYDHFHIVKNFNDKVINEVKKDEIKRLMQEGDLEGAQSLKGSKYILMSKNETLAQKDRDAKDQKVISKAGVLFNKEEVIQKGGNVKRYLEIISRNELLLIAELVKEKLKYAFEADTILKMKRRINSIIQLCKETDNKHFLWFAKLLEQHYQGIINHAKHHISTGKVEGTNRMLKTLRRKSYGIPDDEYFFLKIMDASRN